MSLIAFNASQSTFIVQAVKPANIVIHPLLFGCLCKQLSVNYQIFPNANREQINRK